MYNVNNCKTLFICKDFIFSLIRESLDTQK